MSAILWSLATVAGVVVLFLVLLNAVRKNKQSDVPLERTEEATRELRAELHEEHERKYPNE